MSNLPNYVKTLDELSNKELGWKSPFDVYYGQKLNSLLKASQNNFSGWYDSKTF